MNRLDSRLTKLEQNAGGPGQRPLGILAGFIDVGWGETPWMGSFFIGPDWISTTFYPDKDEAADDFYERVKAECLRVHGQLPLAWETDDAA